MTWAGEEIRRLERASIREFMQKHQHYLQGKVLDFGCGTDQTCIQPQPYKDLVTGTYIPYEKGEPMPMGPFDCIMCNQVLQYVDNPQHTIDLFDAMLYSNGFLVMTVPTNWAEVEETDKWRFTKAGIEHLLRGWRILHLERRAEVILNGFSFPLGYGVVAES
jgi:SAM-dependent methyltransferase